MLLIVTPMYTRDKSKTIEKSTVAFSWYIKFLDLQKAISWTFLRSNSQNGQSVRRNLFGMYVLCYEFFLALRVALSYPFISILTTFKMCNIEIGFLCVCNSSLEIDDAGDKKLLDFDKFWQKLTGKNEKILSKY